MLFFGVYWAWLNFTWFASAFDTDDVGYRLLTLLQMAGVLVLAASVTDAFEHDNYRRDGHRLCGDAGGHGGPVAPGRPLGPATIAGPDCVTPPGCWPCRPLWVVWALLPLPRAGQVIGFLLLAGAEMSVPWWAERAGETSWHARHIAERYGLFTLIVLGECVLAASNALDQANSGHAALLPLLVLGVGGLILLFGLWWLYYLRDAGRGSGRAPQSAPDSAGVTGITSSSRRWPRLGAGLEVAAEAVSTGIESSDLTVSFAVAVPICVFLLVLYYLHRLLPGTELPGLSPP